MSIMSTNEMRDILLRLDWTQLMLADRAHRSYSRIRRMASGRDIVDEPLADWLRRLDRLASTQPRPTGRSVSGVERSVAMSTVNRLGWKFTGNIDEADAVWLRQLDRLLDQPPPPLARTVRPDMVAA